MRASSVLALACGIVAAAAAAQPPAFRTEANYVRVDVFPTRDGAPVNDLTALDFEIFENGAPQRIEQFEHVTIRGGVPPDLRAEPNSVEASRQAAQNPRARLFVVFLDIGHVDVAGSHNIRPPLVAALDHLIGADDLVAVMTPDMSAGDLTFARRTTTIEGFLARHWDWGDVGRTPTDPVEQQYEFCYGPVQQSALTRELIARRREKLTLDALSDLVVHLRGVREERKAVIVVTDGWILYAPDPQLARPLDNRVPTAPPIGVDPRSGRLTARNQSDPAATRLAECDSDRIMYSQTDDRDAFRRLPDEANRANVSFYPIDPRGLPAFDSSIDSPLPLTADANVLRQRADSLRVIADMTDGIAAVNSNDLARGFARIVDDLSSYYLVGYYSTGKLDGKFHAITVRVKRPGVIVRARRGYLAFTPAEAMSRTRPPAADNAGKTAADATARALEATIAPLVAYERDVPIRLNAAAGWSADQRAEVWAVGEFGPGPPGVGAGDADLMLIGSDGATIAAQHVAIPFGVRAFRATLSGRALAPGEYVVRVRARRGADSAVELTSAHIVLHAAPESTGALYARHGPGTANKEAPTADLRFRRSESIRVEIPGASSDRPSARLLDRTGKPLPVPVAAAARDEADGGHWTDAQLALAPLAPGDYAIEIVSGDRRTLAPFRVVP